MNKISIVILFYFSLLGVHAQDMEISGYYNGKNPIILNPFGPTGVGFCIYEVTVNDQLSTDEINSSSFEIDLSVYNLKNGDPLKIIIKHKLDCYPKLINPEVLKPSSTFEIITINIDPLKKVIGWTTKNENGSLEFVIQQFNWNKWTNVGTIIGKGISAENTYSYPVFLHADKNIFRIKQVDHSGKPRYSDNCEFRSLSMPVTYIYNKNAKTLIFSDETIYELFDVYGKKISSGIITSLDVSKFKKGKYYLNFDTKMVEIKL